MTQRGSDQRRNEELRRQQGLAESLIRTARTIILVLDRERRIVSFNPFFEELTGYRLDEVRGRDWVATFVPERDRDRIAAVFQGAVDGQRTRGNVNSILTKRGEERVIEWFDATIDDAAGETTAVLATGQDITERVQAEAVLREREARLSGILETATDGIVTIDEGGAIESFNPAAERLFGWAEAEVRGRDVAVLMPAPFRREHGSFLTRYLETGERKIIGIGREVVGLRKDGTTFPMDLSVGEGFVNGHRFFTGIVRDVTERRELQARLSHSERLAAVGELAAGIAHEVNNPVNTMINCAQLIKDGESDPTLLDDIIEEGDRIASIVRNLLTFARDDREEAYPCSLRSVVERTLALVDKSFRNHGVEVEATFDPDAPPVMVRSQQIQQVCLNLVINAKDALIQRQDLPAEDRRILVRVERADLGGQLAARLRVRDNGTGISAEHLPRIFDPFVTTKRAGGGTGLGLSISRNIVESHRGSIEVETVVGESTEFTVTLPGCRDEDMLAP